MAKPILTDELWAAIESLHARLAKIRRVATPARIGAAQVKAVRPNRMGTRQHRLGLVVAAGDHRRGDRVQRVEQKMRIDLIF